ncbi:GNAT family N-acetyltransferase [Rhizobiales bacterium]|uniref:GNAT family N-acetyltransferase n=1 Tax=Hongsoonwoonella zoysiae TaxID=2821844 RepID=UPI001561973C|nr:GNAT family N-acetyltransferase [Hongsoonwoonella zoysiae]NRG17904.1 GNAT family N-acetyltransferase [Hongsoonwoonella zoysiae]
MPERLAAEISILQADGVEARLGELAGLMRDCVHAGASINFVLPFSMAESQAFWQSRVLPEVRAGTRAVFVAEVDGRIAGTVQLDCGTPPNQPHRAEVAKLMVHPDFRGQGFARGLMGALEAHARDLGRFLITLDTRSGDAAEPLYASLGYETAGIIPDFCRDTVEDRLDPTTIMYKRL